MGYYGPKKWSSSKLSWVRIEEEEKRTVNGLEVLMLKWTVKSERGTLTYLGYFYSEEAGAIQLITWASQKAFPRKRPELEALLNGFEVTKAK